MTNRHMRTRACERMGISPLTGANVKTTSVYSSRPFYFDRPYDII